MEIPREAIRFSGPSLQGFGPKWQRLPTLAFLGCLEIIQMREALRLLGPKSKIASATKIHFGWQNSPKLQEIRKKMRLREACRLWWSEFTKIASN